MATLPAQQIQGAIDFGFVSFRRLYAPLAVRPSDGNQQLRMEDFIVSGLIAAPMVLGFSCSWREQIADFEPNGRHNREGVTSRKTLQQDFAVLGEADR